MTVPTTITPAGDTSAWGYRDHREYVDALTHGIEGNGPLPVIHGTVTVRANPFTLLWDALRHPRLISYYDPPRRVA